MYTPPPGGGFPPQFPGQPFGQQARPGRVRVWHLLIFLILAGAIASMGYSAIALATSVSSLQRVPLPAGGTVTLSNSGDYVLYYEGPGAQHGDLPSFDVRVVPASSGAAVARLTKFGSVVTYSSGSRRGRAVLELTVSRPGQFTIAVSGYSGSSGSDLAVGPNVASGIVRFAAIRSPLVVLSVIAGVIIVIIIWIARSFARRRAYSY